jgi:hypothetical protein
MNSSLGFCGIPPIRQEKGEWMGHGVGTKSIGQSPSAKSRLALAVPARRSCRFLPSCRKSSKIVRTRIFIGVFWCPNFFWTPTFFCYLSDAPGVARFAALLFHMQGK